MDIEPQYVFRNIPGAKTSPCRIQLTEKEIFEAYHAYKFALDRTYVAESMSFWENERTWLTRKPTSGKPAYEKLVTDTTERFQRYRDASSMDELAALIDALERTLAEREYPIATFNADACREYYRETGEIA